MTAGERTLFGGSYSGRRVLVTGHTGFKGAWLTYWLQELGAQVTGLALDPPTEPNLFDDLGLADSTCHTVCDVRDYVGLRDVVSTAQPEVVFHLAAQALVRASYDQPLETMSTNVLGTANLLEALRHESCARVVLNVTSDKCYQNEGAGHAYSEGDPLGGSDPYSASKACSEVVTASYRHSFLGEERGTAVSTARAGNVIGGGDWARDRIVPDCVRALSHHESIVLRNPGAVRPWQHVLEPIAGYLLLSGRLLTDAGRYEGAWNFGPPSQGSTLTVRDLAEAFIDEWGEGDLSIPSTSDQPREAQHLALDSRKAQIELGWESVWSPAEAIRQTVSWYKGYVGRQSDARRLTSACLAQYVGDAQARGLGWAGEHVGATS